MSDIPQTLAGNLAAAPDNISRLISPQKYRNLILSALGPVLPFDPSPQDDAFNTAGNGFFDAGNCWTTVNGSDKKLWKCFAGNHNAADWRQVYPAVVTPTPATIVTGTAPITSTLSAPNTYDVALTSPLSTTFIPTLPKSKIDTTGTWSAAEIPTLPKSKIDTTGTWSAAEIPTLPKSGISTTGTWPVADIPNLPGSIITSGTIPVGQLPTMVGSGGSASGGIVPTPPGSAGTTKFLREDGTWDVPPGAGGATVVSLAANGSTPVSPTVIVDSGSGVFSNVAFVWYSFRNKGPNNLGFTVTYDTVDGNSTSFGPFSIGSGSGLSEAQAALLYDPGTGVVVSNIKRIRITINQGAGASTYSVGGIAIGSSTSAESIL